MCGRFQLGTDGKDQNFGYRFNVNEKYYQTILPNYNIAPSQKIPTVVRKSPNRLVFMKWGLIAKWDKEGKKPIINARSETVFEKSMFRPLVETQRCLIPSTGFYEWQKTSLGKQPYYIGLKNKELFSFAGIYDTWISLQGDKIETCAILTTEPNDLMKPIHNRMPVILNMEDEEIWLNPDIVEEEKLSPLLEPYNDENMISYMISTRINSPFNNDSQIDKKI